MLRQMTLRERREALGLSQTEVARLVGCTPSNICRYEAGAYNPKDKLAAALAKLYGCDEEDIIGKEDT